MNEPAVVPTLAPGHRTDTATIRAAAPKANPVTPWHELRQALGNQGFGRYVQAQLAVGKPGDLCEQEADRVAEQVLRMPDPAGTAPAVHVDRGVRIQRRCAACCDECQEEMQKKDMVEGLPPESDEEQMLHAKSGSGPVAVGPNLESRVTAIRGGGEPLPVPVRDYFEPRFKYDFGDVRLHKDGGAADVARDARALAFTVGRDVVFGPGQFSPDTEAGRRLLAHELTHVVQQSRRAIPLIQRRTPEEEARSRGAPVAGRHTCHTGHVLGSGELIPAAERLGDAETFYYRIWGTWKRSDTALNTFAERVINTWIGWRFGPLALEDRRRVSDFLFTTLLEKIGVGVGEAGCDYAVALSKPVLAKAVELSGEAKRARDVTRAREELAANPGATPDYAQATVNQRLVLLEDRIRLYWTGNKDEQAILDILKSTPDDQAAELSRRLSTDRYGDETYFAALDRVVDLGNNLDLHTELTKLHLRGLGGEKGAKAILEDAPVLPWHDVMGFGHDVPVTFSATPGSGGKIVIKYHRGYTLSDTDMPYQDELDALPSEIKIGGRAYDGDQLFKVHDWDEGKFVVVRARDLLAYQNIGIRNWLGHMATVASFAIPGGAATTTAGKVALFAIERAIPLLILATRENRLSLIKWFPTWGPRMIYFADVAELAIGLYGVANFARSGVKFFNAWREARFARKLWDAANSLDDAEKAAVRIENDADKVLNAVDEFQHAESAAGHVKPVGAPPVDPPGSPTAPKSGAADAVGDARAAAAETPTGGPGASPHGTPTGEKVLASEPVKGGHHVDVTPAGIELCSPKPCPLLRVEFAAELERNPALGKQMDALDTLRKSDPAAAARKAADLRETLAYTRSHQRLFQGLQSRATPAQQARLAKLLDTAEDAGIHVGERQLDEISRRLQATRNQNQIEQELAALEQDLERATAVKSEVDDASRLGGGSRTGDRAQQLPEGTDASGTTTKPRTATLSDAELLAANLTKRIGPRPPGHEAHHIVPKGMQEADEAREILLKANIGINDAENGIWLPKDSSIGNEFTSDIHSKVHTARAIRLITEQLREGAKDGPAGVRRALRSIQRTLSDLKFER